MVVVLLLNRPEAPDPGAVNVTLTPATGLLPASRTVTASALAKAVLTVADCGVVPALAVIVVALPAVLVSEKLTLVSPLAAAVTVYGPPAVALAVNGAAATPDALVATVIVVVLLENRPEAPDPGAVNVTLTPATGLLPASRTVTASALAKAVLTVADCGVVPALAVIVVALPAVLVSEKLTVVRPVAAAVTVYGPPAVALAVNGAAATPDALVATVIVVVLLENRPDAPLPGAVNVTLTPGTGLLPASRTVTASALAKAVLTVADCGVTPLFAFIVAALPAVLVSEKLTVVRPVAAAVTVYGPPAVALAVNGAAATPDALVATVIVVVLLENRPEAPDPGAVNVTLTPGTGLLPASRTGTASALAKAVLTVADCGVVPALAVIVVALPAVLVSEKLTLVSPLAAAVTVYGPPAVALAVNGAAATPDALVATVIVVVLLETRPEAPDPGAVNVTLTPATGLLPASRTVTASALAKAVLTVADCGVTPLFAFIVAALPAVLVSEKLTVVRPVAAAVTVYGPPAVALAVNGAAATPDALVATVIVVVLLENRPDAPLPGAVNVTLTPGTGLLPASRTVTASALAKAVLTVADCGVVPAFAVIVAALPAVLVSEKLTVVRPVAAAVTVYGPPAVALAVNGAAATPDALAGTGIVLG